MANMFKGMVIKLRPTEEQHKQLWQAVSAARLTYNKCVEAHRNGASIPTIAELRATHAWLCNVSETILKQAMGNYTKALKEDEPRFKSCRTHHGSAQYNEGWAVNTREGYVSLPHIGRVYLV